MYDDLIIISPYPLSGTYSHAKSALASFSKNLVDKLKTQVRITVFADQIEGNQAIENNVQIKRVWQKNDSLLYLKLFLELLKMKNISKILIQYEWNLFGKSILYLMAFPFFLLSLSFIGKKVFVVTHGILIDFDGLNQFSLLKSKTLSIAARVFYILIALFSQKIIVTEQTLKTTLNKIGIPTSKIEFIPHGVDTNIKHLEKQQAKNEIGIDTTFLVYFGFLTAYKGPDILLDLFNKNFINQNNTSLYFVGGESRNLKNDPEYRTFVNNFYEKAKHASNVKITGFVEEKDFNIYLNACDLMIFPYRMLLSSSGPLSFAFSYEKPFLLSKPLEKYFESPDFQEALVETELNKEDLIFDFNDFAEKVQKALVNPEKYIKFSQRMKEKRSWDKVAKLYLKILTI